MCGTCFELDEESRANKSVSTLVRPIRFVPENRSE